MSGLLALKPGLTYGPVHSRRLGRSLGINVLPTAGKACSFDCAYCQYGWTRWHEARAREELGFAPVPAVLAALEATLASLPEPPAYLTFSGNGEPTLHPRFAELVEGVRALRDRLLPAARVAVLSNSTTVSDREVRAALGRLDVRIMKLDAGDETTFVRFNCPAPGISLAGILDGLRTLPGVTLQTLFAGGAGGNAAPVEVDAWIDAARTVHPIAVQIYTLDRGWPARDLEPLTRDALLAIRDRARRLGLSAETF
jgi:wyosine [tRNA(Phe)-imidazoG37] synthetase (radical SAM superfamily)